ncbi:hypothetical protein L1987_14256 [Smallanthus sonchifolius]|uniref:Uncharacterized protein n=1 Tax=Smallanthus sonchifolius TaxID=185202 RepID=A0ACB9J4E9_9ASTR|nr:hypothetical protein L1987_14256 [Smallanthus sonchifolius]
MKLNKLYHYMEFKKAASEAENFTKDLPLLREAGTRPCSFKRFHFLSSFDLGPPEAGKRSGEAAADLGPGLKLGLAGHEISSDFLNSEWPVVGRWFDGGERIRRWWLRWCSTGCRGGGRLKSGVLNSEGQSRYGGGSIVVVELIVALFSLMADLFYHMNLIVGVAASQLRP